MSQPTRQAASCDPYACLCSLRRFLCWCISSNSIAVIFVCWTELFRVLCNFCWCCALWYVVLLLLYRKKPSGHAASIDRFIQQKWTGCILCNVFDHTLGSHLYDVLDVAFMNDVRLLMVRVTPVSGDMIMLCCVLLSDVCKTFCVVVTFRSTLLQTYVLQLQRYNITAVLLYICCCCRCCFDL